MLTSIENKYKTEIKDLEESKTQIKNDLHNKIKKLEFDSKQITDK